MSTQPIEPIDLVLRSPIQVAASVPYLLGFMPADSLVVIFVSDEGHHVLTTRVDLANGGRAIDELRDATANMCLRAGEYGARRAHAVAFCTSKISQDAIVNAHDAVLAATGRTGLFLDSFASVCGGLWRAGVDLDASPEVLTEVGVAAAAQWVAKGVTFESSREELTALVRGPETECAVRVRTFVESQPPGWAKSIVRTVAERRATEDQILEFLADRTPGVVGTDARPPVTLPTAADLARWSLSLADSRVREPILWHLAHESGADDDSRRGHGREVLNALCLLLRNTPSEVAAPLASCVAAYAWQLGNGAMASIAAEYGLACSDDNVLCGLVGSAVVSGAHPSIWLDMMMSMSLAELRRGPHRTRRPTQPGSENAGRKVRDCPG